MTTSKGHADFFDRYNALAVADQTVLQALSALYEPAAAGIVSSCLGAAGCRESPLRAFSPQNVHIRLARLAKAGFLVESTVTGRSGKIKLWRCRPEVGEMAMRHAVRDGRFLPIARAALSETRGRDWLGEGSGDSPRRRLHLHFHAADWPAAATELANLSRESAGTGGALLCEVIAAQSDDSWLRSGNTAALYSLLAACLRDLPDGPFGSDAAVEVARYLTDRTASDATRDDLALALLDVLVFKGRFREAGKLPLTLAAEEARLAADLALAVAEGSGGAPEAGERAIAGRRARLGGREGLLPGMAAVWQALAVMMGDDPVETEVMLRRLSSPAAREHERAAILHCLRHVFLFMTGQPYAARSLPAAPPDGKPLTALFHALSALRVEPSRLPGLRQALEDAGLKAQAVGYRWLASQLQAAAAGEPADGTAPGARQWPMLADLFRGDDAWRRGLKALEEVAGAPDALPDAAGKRVAWIVGFPARPEDLYCPVTLQPVEQSLGKDGLWSKGRSISLKRIFQRRDDLPFATERDRLAFSTLRLDYSGQGAGYIFDSGATLPYLVGHPLVFRGDEGGAKLEIVPGEFELSVTAKGEGCEISLEPPLSEFQSEGAAPATDATELPDTMARLETPTRLRIVRLGDRERRLAMAVGDGLVIPKEGRAEAVETLTRLSGKMRLHSDIPELGGGGETVEADSRPRFHILPQNPGIKVEVWSHPLGDDGPAYRPGRGGKALLAEVGGREVRTLRDKRQEKELAAKAVAACPSLAGNAEGDLAWRLADPESALAFLAETEDLAGNVVLAWPKGGRFRVRRFGGAGRIDIRVTSSREWFELDGSVRVDDDLVIGMDRLLAAIRESPGRFVALGDGEYLALTEELRRQLGDLEALGERHGCTFRLSALAGSVIEDLAEAGAELRADAEWLRQLERRKSLAEFNPELPGGFTADLRDYQMEGYRWLARLAEWGAGACLADDMGLGKTVQALAILARRAPLGPALIVAPTSVCHNWLAETRRFAPGLNMAAFGAGPRESQLARLGSGDAVITSYSLLRQEEKLFAGVKWATIVLDEAQAIKNAAAKRSQAAMTLEAGFRLITTGTPIENHLGELWNLFHFINPRLLGSLRRFQEKFAAPIERLGDKEAGDRLRRAIRPFILRRTKKQVLESLPPKTEITLAVELGAEERAFYESLRRGALAKLEAEPAAAEKKRFLVLAEIMRLRRACCSPQLIHPDASISSAKQEQFRATLADLVENGHKVLVFSQFVDHLSIIRQHLDKEGFSYQYLDGSTPAVKRKKAVEDFQAGQGDVFLISLKAGGLGLNLTAADYVIHMDPWWNPAVEDQASDRAHRIGQDKPVTVYRLVAANTIEEKIVQLHRDKRDLADSLLSGADQAASLDMDEIMRLLREE